MTDIINNVAKSNRNLDRLDVLFNGDDTATYTDENANIRGSLSHQIKDVQASEVQLGDFEQGDWVPSFQIDGSSDNVLSILSYAKYSVIRDVVSLTCRFLSIQITNYPTTGDFAITGLPFPSSAHSVTRLYFGAGIAPIYVGVPTISIYNNNDLQLGALSDLGQRNISGSLLTQDIVHSLFFNIKYLRQST